MDMIFAAIVIVTIVILIGFFKTKTDGYGPYNTTILLIIPVFSFATLAFFSEKIPVEIWLNIATGIVGFVVGTIATRIERS